MLLPEPKGTWEGKERNTWYGTNQIAIICPVVFRNEGLVGVLLRTIIP